MSGALSPPRRLPLFLLLSGLTLTLILACSCSSVQKAKPPDDPVLTDLARWLQLDPEQQEKTRQLLGELGQRYAQIREKWDKGARVRPEQLLESRAIFQSAFLAILTVEQKKIYTDLELKMQGKENRPVRSRS